MDFIRQMTLCVVCLTSAVNSAGRLPYLPRTPTVEVVLNGPSLIQVLDEAVVSATIRHPSSDVDYKFFWDFGDDDGGSGSQWTTILKKNATSSVASHKYGIPGDYSVRVNASTGGPSAVLSSRLSSQLSVVEPIKYVRLRPLLDVYGASINRVTGTTDPVAFEAWTYHGGSHVQFAFDFGDGPARKAIVRGQLDVMRSVFIAQATHVYSNVGSYKVSVTAFNPLGNRSCSMSAPFVVRRLELERSYYVTSPNNVTRFGVTLQNNEGGVTYDWNFGNGVTFIGAGAEVNYSYPVSGTFELSVSVHTVSIQTTGRVFVLQLLEGVRVKIAANSSRRPIFATDESVEFVAELSPTAVNIGTRVVFHWRWIIIGHGLDEERNSHGGATRTIVGRLTNTFVNEGRYSLWVRADNSVSETVSERFQFDVLSPIAGLRRIQHSGSVVLGLPVVFRARFWYGSNVTLHWNFGDAGAAPISSSRTDHVLHFYNRTGEFRVSVRLTNALSDAEMTSVIFVVNERCDKPEVTILGVNEYDKLKIRRSGVLRLGAGGEGGSKTMCDAATTVNHTWYVDSMGRHDRLAVRRLVFNGRMLTLSAAGFDVGTHNVSLKVELVGTIVYAMATTSFEVLAERSSLKIFGGSGRLIGRSQTVVLRVNASLVSKTSPKRFRWRCSPLGKPKTDCGLLGSVSDHVSDNQLLATSELSVSASNLDLQFSSFLFTLTACPAYVGASQLIEISPAAKTLDLIVTCESCVNGEVAFKQDIILLVVQCASCSSNVVYEWQVWLVHDGKQNLPISDHDCVNPDGSTFFLNASSSLSSEHDEDLGFNSTSLFNYTGGDIYQAAGLDAVNWLPIEEVDFMPNHTSIDVARFNVDAGQMERNPVEGFAGDAGSVSARRFSSGRASGSNLYEESLGAYDAKSVRPVKALKSTADHILKSGGDSLKESVYAREWKFVHLDESDTLLSGFHQKQFRLNPDVLRIGRTYVFVVSARAGATDAFLQGKASQEVTVSLGPTNGRCSLMPLVGREYETNYKLNCYEWKATVGDGDDDSATSAIFYELSYSLSADEGSNVLLYYGLDNNFKFVLPAGLANASHQVTLNVIVWQESGSNTVVCSIPRTVLPLGELPNSTVSHILSRELVASASSNISVHLKWNDFGSALNRIQVLASALNRMEPVLIGGVQVQLAHRRRLLKFLFKGQLTYSAEALQLLHAIHEIYRQPESVDFELMRSSLKALRKASKFYWSFNASCKPFCWHGLRALFLATNAVLENVLLSDVSFANGTRLMNSAFTVLQKTSAPRLSAICEKNVAASVFPLRASTLALNAVCAHLDAARSVALDGIRVTFINGSVTDCHCVLSLVSRAVYGRFAADNGSRTAYATMTSVRVWDADVWLKKNAAMVAVDIPVPVLTIDANVSSSTFLGTHHTLSIDKMNVHEFKLPATIGNKNSMLSVTLRFGPTSDMSAVLLLLSDHYPPSLKNSIARHRVSVVPGTSLNLTFFDDHRPLEGLVSDTTAYYLALFDSASLLRPAFPSSANSADYLLDVQLVDCLQWNSESESWIGSGCQIEPFVVLIHCRCDQLSSYTAAWRSLDTIDTVASLDHVIGRRLNPFVPVVLIVCLVLYILLCSPRSRWAIQVSKHQCGAAYLADNPPHDRHFYAVTLQTGRCSQSGTTAKVHIVLHGYNGTSEPRELTVGDDLRSGVFQRGSLNTFLLTSPLNLGRIFKVQIWHDNSGMSPAWFLEHVIVENVQRGKKQYFECHKWFAIERDDGKIEREIYVEESNRRLLIFQRLFVSLYWTFGAFTGWPVIFGRLESGHITHDDRTLIAALSVAISSVMAASACRQDLQFTQFSGIFELPQPSLKLLKVSCCVASVGFVARLCLAIVLHFSKLPSCVTASNVIVENDDLNRMQTSTANEKTYSAVRPLTADEPIEKFSVLQDWAERQWLKNIGQYYSEFSSTSDSVFSNVLSIIGEPTTATVIEYPRGFRFILPVAVRYFVWIICVGSIIYTVTISIVIGVTFSRELSYIWLQVVLLSITVDVSVFGPILNAFGGMVFAVVSSIRKGFVSLPSVRACFCRCGDQKFEQTGFADGVGFGLRRFQSLNDDDDSFRRQCSAKKRSREVRFARPPTKKQLLKYKALATKTMKMIAYLKEFLASIFVFIILAGAIFSQDNSAVYRLNRHLERTITRHETMSLFEVFSRSTFFEWMEREFVDILYRQDCGRNDTRCVRGTTSVVLGSVKMSRPPSSTCDTGVINLPKSREAVTSLLRQLDENEWLRNDTRQITLSLLLYNIPTKIFSSVKLQVRFSMEDASTVQVDSALLSAENYPLNVVSSFSKVFLFFCALFLTSCALLKSRDQVEVIQIMFLVTLSIYFIASHCLAVTSQRILDNFLKKSPEDIDLSSALILKQVCAGLVGTAMTLHLTSVVCLLRVCPPFANRFVRFIRTYSVVTSVTVCVALIGFACLCSLSLDEGGMEPRFPVLRFLFELLTGCGHFDGRKGMMLPVCTVTFFAFLFLAILNRTRFLVPTSCTENFSVEDLFQFVRKRICSSFARRQEKNHDTVDYPPKLSVEFLLAELESQVQAMCSMTSELSMLAVNDSFDQDDDQDSILGVVFPGVREGVDDSPNSNGNADEMSDYLVKKLLRQSSATSIASKFRASPTTEGSHDKELQLEDIDNRELTPDDLSSKVYSHLDVEPDSVNLCSTQRSMAVQSMAPARRRIRRTTTRGKGGHGDEVMMSVLQPGVDDDVTP